MISLPLVVANADTATFDCSSVAGARHLLPERRARAYPRGAGGHRGRAAASATAFAPGARKMIEADGFTSARTKLGQPMVR